MDYLKIKSYASREENKGLLKVFDGRGSCEEPGCGDVMEFTIKTHREIITEIGFTITESACLPVKASAAITAEIAKGKPVLEAYLIDKDQIGQKVGGLEEEYVHCALMAELALKRAIVNYVYNRSMEQSLP